MAVSGFLPMHAGALFLVAPCRCWPGPSWCEALKGPIAGLVGLAFFVFCGTGASVRPSLISAHPFLLSIGYGIFTGAASEPGRKGDRNVVSSDHIW